MVICFRKIFAHSTISKQQNIQKRIRIVAACSVLTGGTWILGVFAIGELTLTFQILFTIFNSLQGFFIFMFYCALSSDVRKEWIQRCCPSSSLFSTSSSGARKESSSQGPSKVQRKATRQKSNSAYTHETELSQNKSTSDGRVAFEMKLKGEKDQANTELGIINASSRSSVEVDYAVQSVSEVDVYHCNIENVNTRQDSPEMDPNEGCEAQSNENSDIMAHGLDNIELQMLAETSNASKNDLGKTFVVDEEDTSKPLVDNLQTLPASNEGALEEEIAPEESNPEEIAPKESTPQQSNPEESAINTRQLSANSNNGEIPPEEFKKRIIGSKTKVYRGSWFFES